jgi:adenylate cyclase
LSEASQPAPAWLGRYHEAIQLFRRQQFGEARKMFQAILAELGGKDFLCQMYSERCELYGQDPPPAGWNGTFVLTEK